MEIKNPSTLLVEIKIFVATMKDTMHFPQPGGGRMINDGLEEAREQGAPSGAGVALHKEMSSFSLLNPEEPDGHFRSCC